MGKRDDEHRDMLRDMGVKMQRVTSRLDEEMDSEIRDAMARMMARHADKAIREAESGDQQKQARDLPPDQLRQLSRSMLSKEQVDEIVDAPGFEDLTPQEKNMRREAVFATLQAICRAHAILTFGKGEYVPQENAESRRLAAAMGMNYVPEMIERRPFRVQINGGGFLVIKEVGK